jgi:Ser/Thr protein kinase RdoA (MazF antagonist)
MHKCGGQPRRVLLVIHEVEPRAILRRLLETGLLIHDDIQTDGFAIEERVGRNYLMLIKTRDRTLSLKFFDSAASYSQEVIALRSLADATLAFSVPCLLRIEQRTILAQTNPKLRPLGAVPRAPGILTSAVVRRVTKAIATLHNCPIPPGLPHAYPAVDPRGVGPWILDSPPAAREMVRDMQDTDIREPLTDLMLELDECEPVFSHGDLRPGNILLDRSGRVWVIDWETAGPDPRWRDLAALLASVVELAIAAGKGPPPETLIHALRDTYAAHAGVSPNISLIMRCAGARLLQAAVERAHHEWPLTPQTHAVLTVGRMFLLRPTEGAVRVGLMSCTT